MASACGSHLWSWPLRSHVSLIGVAQPLSTRQSFDQYWWRPKTKTHWVGRASHDAIPTFILSVEWASVRLMGLRKIPQTLEAQPQDHGRPALALPPRLTSAAHHLCSNAAGPCCIFHLRFSPSTPIQVLERSPHVRARAQLDAALEVMLIQRRNKQTELSLWSRPDLK